MTFLLLDHVTYRYPDGTPALDDVSFALERGDRVALLGPTGAGKSTLLQHLNGLLAPNAGRIVVDGLVVGRDTAREVRRRVGLVFQNPDDQLFLPTLLEDVAFGPLNDGVAAREAGAMAGETLNQLGLQAEAGRAAHHLSGGERRLAALATVLVSSPPILALDEPSGDLDARGRHRLATLLRARPETLIVATHDLELARGACRRAVVLVEGRVAWDGGLSELLGSAALLERYGLAMPPGS
ncbi:MAG TPA: ABC transporter ATP-binding protein [Gemmatimonadales bacterium]|nr:ABC transporter ATP-binding protein [Gemmatimonadales bacterium]